MFKRDETWATQRCYLRAPSEEDLEVIWSASRYPGFNDGMTWNPPETKQELIENLAQAIADWDHHRGFTWTMVDTSINSIIGRFGIRVEDEPTDTWSIGYWVHPKFQGRGYATEGAKALVEMGFTRLNATKVTASHAKWNTASGRVLENAGLIRVGETERGFKKFGAWVAEYIYELKQTGGRD